MRMNNLFIEAEILYFIDSLIGALSFLQKKGISHQRLNFDNIYIV